MAYEFSSMSLVLNNPDLLQIIFEYFDLCNLECIMAHDYSLIQRRTRQSLLWAALTSRAFLEPAMNVLWQKMESILPLYLILPGLRKQEEEDEEEDEDDEDDEDDEGDEGDESEYSLTDHEPLNCDSVQRMVFYARRIRSLHFHCEWDNQSEIDIHLGLSIAYFTRINQLNAFLSLRELTVESNLFKFQYTTLRTISAPNLEDFALVQIGLSPQEENMTHSFLKALACKSHHIKTLVIEGNHTDLTFSVLPKFSEVQNLTIYPRQLPVISLSLLEKIASMTSLQSLKMDLDSSQFKNDLKNSSHHAFQFISLTNLVVEGDLQCVKKVLEVVHTPLLCYLSLTVNIPGPGFDTCTSIQSIIPVKMIDKVRSFLVSSQSSAGPIHFGSRITPFITFEQLERFSVHVQTLHIPTMHLATFLDNNCYLSKLGCLKLNYDRPSEINQSLSIAALPLIADTCPKLSYLSISIYHPDRSEMQVTTRSGRSHNLQILRFDSLPDWDDSTSFATAFSSFLDHLFPEITNTIYSQAGSRKKWWKDVQDMIKAHQTRRVRNESD